MEIPSSSIQEPKLEWSQPKLVELDVNNTEGGTSASYTEDATYNNLLS